LAHSKKIFLKNYLNPDKKRSKLFLTGLNYHISDDYLFIHGYISGKKNANMKKLFLIRHAKSSWKEQGSTDHERPLNHRGMKDAPFMAKILNKAGIEPDVIISSDALRARMTAEIFADILHYPKEEILTEPDLYLAGIHDFLRQVNMIDDKSDCAFLVSHNPGISEFIRFLTGDTYIDMPTCAIYGIEFDIESWRLVKQGTGRFILFEYPKKHIAE
jgi:phosphohistidine phosphatase